MGQKTFKHTFYLAFKPKSRGLYSDKELIVRVTEKQPSLQSGEVSMRLVVELPKALFERPSLAAEIIVPEGKVSPTVITADVAENIAATIKQHLGIEMKITVPTPLDPKGDGSMRGPDGV